jgi:uncharacterized membrane protein
VSARRDILDWAEQGLIAPQDVPRALRAGGALPTARDWRRFVERLLLWLGTVLVAAGVVFFVAYNWDALGRFAKLGLVQTLVIAALGVVAWVGLDRAGGKAALLAAAVLVGALLALVGQIYQTGADTFELFAAWGLAILPWAVVGRSAPLWLLWLAVANLAVTLYYTTFGVLFGLVLGPERMLWVLFALNTLALVAWEIRGRRPGSGLAARWAPRLLAAVSGALVTVLAILDVLSWRGASGWGLIAWLGWLGVAYFVYRRWQRDLFVLAVGVSSAIAVVVTFVARHLVGHEAGGFLIVALVVIGLSAVGTKWLRAVAAEEDL